LNITKFEYPRRRGLAVLQRIKDRFVDAAARLLAAVLRQPVVRGQLLPSDQELESKLVAALEKPAIRERLWATANVRPLTDSTWVQYPNSISVARMRIAAQEAAEFVSRQMPPVESRPTPFEVLNFCLDLMLSQGLMLEFGVFSGTTINHIAARCPEREIHGFDSFQGLPESWGAVPKGTFDAGGTFPPVRANVRLHAGWFDVTLPEFLARHDGPVAFVHIDSDLYSSARTVLEGLAPRMVPGTIVVFDEFMNYPRWKEHEYKAFFEFVDRHRVEFEYLTYADRGYSLAVRIRAIRAAA
jgi:predicted O-methyltransferase YrrM